MSEIVAINRVDRWFVYQRLQQLEISCQCCTNKPLLVEINNTKEAILLWSVVKQINSNRDRLICWLNNCWQIDCDCEE